MATPSLASGGRRCERQRLTDVGRPQCLLFTRWRCGILLGDGARNGSDSQGERRKVATESWRSMGRGGTALRWNVDSGEFENLATGECVNKLKRREMVEREVHLPFPRK